MTKPSYSISDLSSEFSITTRTIRFYEEKGLIQPRRTAGNQRRYTPKDRVRLKLILRGRRFGYRLDEIAKMIGMADVDIDEIDQIRRALRYGDSKLSEIRHQIKELKAMQQDMETVRNRLIRRLAELEKEAGDV
jgi:DNA-binding transcriptional MerR regulator